MDEHNEFFHVKEDTGLTPIKSQYFYSYSQWTGKTSGDRTITIYSGSAHSKFHLQLKAGDEVREIPIFPFEDEELQKLYHEFCKELGKESENCPPFEKIKVLTGKLPRELYFLVIEYKCNEEDYLDKRMGKFSVDLENYFKTLTNYTIQFKRKIRQMKIIKEGTHRLFEEDINTKKIVSDMLQDLKINGLDAVRKYSMKLDNWNPENFELTEKQIEKQ